MTVTVNRASRHGYWVVQAPRKAIETRKQRLLSLAVVSFETSWATITRIVHTFAVFDCGLDCVPPVAYPISSIISASTLGIRFNHTGNNGRNYTDEYIIYLISIENKTQGTTLLIFFYRIQKPRKPLKVVVNYKYLNHISSLKNI